MPYDQFQSPRNHKDKGGGVIILSLRKADSAHDIMMGRYGPAPKNFTVFKETPEI